MYRTDNLSGQQLRIWSQTCGLWLTAAYLDSPGQWVGHTITATSNQHVIPPHSDDVCSHVLFSTHHFVPAESVCNHSPLQYHIIMHLAICHSLNQSAVREISENDNISDCMNTVWDFQLPWGDVSHLLTISSITYIVICLNRRPFTALSPFASLCRPYGFRY
jgi:hypothetical protein